MRPSRAARIVLIAAAVAIAGACTDHTLLQPAMEPAFASAGHKLLECPAHEARSARGIIGALGGSLAVGPHRITLPPGAVLSPTELTITEPATRFVEIRIKANGVDGFAFLEPASISISYERCTRNLDHAQLTIYKIDPETKALIRHMGGVDDKAAHRVTVSSDSLSGYSIAQ